MYVISSQPLLSVMVALPIIAVVWFAPNAIEPAAFNVTLPTVGAEFVTAACDVDVASPKIFPNVLDGVEVFPDELP